MHLVNRWQESPRGSFVFPGTDYLDEIEVGAHPIRNERIRSSSASGTLALSTTSENRSLHVWRRTCGVRASNSPLNVSRSSAKILFIALSDRGAPVPMAIKRNG